MTVMITFAGDACDGNVRSANDDNHNDNDNANINAKSNDDNHFSLNAEDDNKLWWRR